MLCHYFYVIVLIQAFISAIFYMLPVLFIYTQANLVFSLFWVIELMVILNDYIKVKKITIILQIYQIADFMLVVNAIIQGGYELIILKWSNACTQTYVFLVLGLVPLISLLVTRKAF